MAVYAHDPGSLVAAQPATTPDAWTAVITVAADRDVAVTAPICWSARPPHLMMAAWDFARFARTSRSDERFHGLVTFGPVFNFFTIVVNGIVGSSSR